MRPHTNDKDSSIMLLPSQLNAFLKKYQLSDKARADTGSVPPHVVKSYCKKEQDYNMHGCAEYAYIADQLF